MQGAGEAFGELRKAGRASTTNPKSMMVKDVEAFLDWMKKRKTNRGIGLKGATQANYIGYLTNLFRWVDNPVTDRMKMAHHVRFPQKVSPEIKVLSEEKARQLVSSLETMPGWEGSVARFMIAMYAYSGLRRSELRQARIQDLDTATWNIVVVHPKGEKRWASAGMAPILPPARKEVMRFLSERREYLDFHGVNECEPLVPRAWQGGIVNYWTGGMWYKVEQGAQLRRGMPFCLQKMTPRARV